METHVPRLLSFEEIDDELNIFEEQERRRLGLDSPSEQWADSNPCEFTKEQRNSTTILFGGLTLSQDTLISAALSGLGYQTAALPCPDSSAMRLGREFGNRGQCNPTYFTVGNLLKQLQHLRDVEQMSVQEIVDRFVFVTAGACGPCRFGTYATEYRKALRDAGFDGFRVLLFQQEGGLRQACGGQTGLQFNPQFFMQLLKAIVAGDVLNLMACRIRPYELKAGATNHAVARCREILVNAFRERRSVLLALRRCRSELLYIRRNRLQPKPRVAVTGEFWAMTTEGDGSYKLQEFLESEGAEVDIQPVISWLLYMIWQNRYDTLRRINLRGTDRTRRGLRGRSPRLLLSKLWIAERLLRGLFRAFARAAGLLNYQLPDMEAIAELAHEHYHVELRGGEGHMEVGKLIDLVRKRKAHMVVSVKPFGCMPSSGVSDGIQSTVLRKYPNAIFCPVETTGDGAVSFHSRIQMYLFKAHRQAREEFVRSANQSGYSESEIENVLTSDQTGALRMRSGPFTGTGANLVANSG